jgi:hypothetical protein
MPPVVPPYVIHAAGRVTGATGALNATQKGFSASVRTGAGDYLLTVGEQIDFLSEGVVGVTLRTADLTCRIVAAGDTTVQVLTRNATPAAADADFDIFVLRYNYG